MGLVWAISHYLLGRHEGKIEKNEEKNDSPKLRAKIKNKWNPFFYFFLRIILFYYNFGKKLEKKRNMCE